MNNTNQMGIIRIICKPYIHIFWLIMCIAMPWKWRYKFYIYIDEKEYKINSKQKQVEIHVIPGEHLFLATQMKKTIGNIADKAGDILKVSGFVTGNAGTMIAGAGLKKWKLNVGDYTKVEVQSGEILEIKLRRNLMHLLVIDE